MRLAQKMLTFSTVTIDDLPPALRPPREQVRDSLPLELPLEEMPPPEPVPDSGAAPPKRPPEPYLRQG